MTVVSLADFKERKTPEAPVSAKKKIDRGIDRGIGVIIRPPGAPAYFGVLGGNIPASVPLSFISDDKDVFDLAKIGREIRKQRGVTLELRVIEETNSPEPPAPRGTKRMAAV